MQQNLNKKAMSGLNSFRIWKVWGSWKVAILSFAGQLPDCLHKWSAHPIRFHWFWVKWSVLGAFASNYNLQRGLTVDHCTSISTDNPWRAKWLSRSSDGVGHFSTCTALKNHLVVRRPTTRLLTQECPPYPISLILGKMVSSWCICVQLQSSERVEGWSLGKHINWQSLKSKVTFSFLWWCGALFNMHSTEKPSCRSQVNYQIADTSGVPTLSDFTDSG